MGCSSSKELDRPIKHHHHHHIQQWNNTMFLLDTSSPHGALVAAPSYPSAHAPRRPRPLQPVSASRDPPGNERPLPRNNGAGNNSFKEEKTSEVGMNFFREVYGKPNASTSSGTAVWKSLPDVTLGLPTLPFETGRQSYSPNERLPREAETVNTWELMAGLDDEDIPSKITSPATKAAAAPLSSSRLTSGNPSRQVTDSGLIEAEGTCNGVAVSALSSTIGVSSSEKSGSQRESNSYSRIGKGPLLPSAQAFAPVGGKSFGKKAGSRERPKSFSTIRTVEELDATLGRCTTPPVSWKNSSRRISDSDTTATSVYNSSRDPQIPLLIRRQSSQIGGHDERMPQRTAVDKEEDLKANASLPLFIVISGKSPPGNLTRLPRNTRSFKDVISNNRNKSFNSEGIVSEVKSKVDKDDSELISRSELLESDCQSTPSSPEFSAAASLKDWLPDKAPRLSILSQTDDFPNGVRCSIFGAVQEHVPVVGSSDKLSQHVSSPALSKTGCSLKKPAASPKIPNAGRKTLQVFDSSLDKFEAKSEEHDSPIFFPELLESFEKAMTQLTEEEWNVLRQMEEDNLSPRNFLDVVQSLCGKKQTTKCDSIVGNPLNRETSWDAKKGTLQKGSFLPGEDVAAKGNKILEASTRRPTLL